MLCAGAVVAERQVVLVAAATSPLHDLDSLELRKLYLGYSVRRDGRIVKGLRNTGDEELNRIFLQAVVAMSEKSYRRRLLSLPLRQGIPRPSGYAKSEHLLNALSRNPYSVTYMWKEAADRSTDVKTLKVLWQQD
jgi:hypothetical protein